MTLQSYLTYFDEVFKPTEPLFRLVPPDKIDWKPTEKSFTAGQLISHIGGALWVYGNGIIAGKWGFHSMEEVHIQNRSTQCVTVDEAVKKLNTNYAEFKRLMNTLTEEDFSHGNVDTPQLGRVPRWRIAMMGIEHHINHKTELFMYLKLLGVDVNTESLYWG